MFEKFRMKKQVDEPPEVMEVEQIKLSNEEIEDLKGKAEAMDEEKIQNFSKHYSERWTLEEVPMKNKAIIVGALGYFILPIDLIPDVTPGVGYTDDIGILLSALWQVSIFIDTDVKNQAKEKLKDWFGEDIDTSDVDDKLV